MLLHYCQLVVLDVLREHLFVKETQLLPRNLFFLFLWLQGRERARGTRAPAKPLSGQHLAAKEGAQARDGLSWSPTTPLPLGSALSKLSWTRLPDPGFKTARVGSQLTPMLLLRGGCWSRDRFSMHFWGLKPSSHSG